MKRALLIVVAALMVLNTLVVPTVAHAMAFPVAAAIAKP